MKKVAICVALCCLAASCSDQKTPENKSNGTANKPAGSSFSSPNKTEVAVNAPVAGQTPPAVKIEQLTEIAFTPGALPADWRWLDPENKSSPTKYDTKSGVLHIDVPSGKDLYGENRTAPRLMRSISGDFEIETKINFDPKDVYQGAGLLVFRNDSNYLRLERGYGGVGGGENGIRFDRREDEDYNPIVTQNEFPTDAKTVELKIRRTGREFTAFWRLPEAEWKEVGKYPSSYPETVQVGLIVCNTAQEIPVEFAYIKLSPTIK